MAESWTIGSRGDCDVVVDLPRVSGRHCRLVRDQDGFVLEDLGSTNGTYLNGVRLTGAVRVTPEDSITLGVSAPMPWPPEAALPVAAVTPTLRSVPAAGPESCSSLVFRTASMVIGRAPDCDHVLDLPIVSGHHARLCRVDDQVWIEDLGSANGTFVNGRRIDRRTAVKSGDAINLGTHSLVLAVAERAFEPGPMPARVATRAARPSPALLLAALIGQAPIAALLIVGALTATTPALTPKGATVAPRATAAVLFWLGLAAIWFGLSDALVENRIDRRRPPFAWVSAVAGAPGARWLVVGMLVIVQCGLAWVIVTLVAGLRGPALAELALLILSAAVGLALGLLLGALAPRPAVAWGFAAVAVLALGVFGGGAWRLARMPPIARVAAAAAPSRWAFEGLLLLEAGRTPAAAGDDLAEDAFPAESERMGVQADVMALALLAIGLAAVAAFIAHERGQAPAP
jgi:pSer/pThr/pTyr-binding forkhead associated (FHA) protein